MMIPDREKEYLEDIEKFRQKYGIYMARETRYRIRKSIKISIEEMIDVLKKDDRGKNDKDMLMFDPKLILNLIFEMVKKHKNIGEQIKNNVDNALIFHIEKAKDELISKYVEMEYNDDKFLLYLAHNQIKFENAGFNNKEDVFEWIKTKKI